MGRYDNYDNAQGIKKAQNKLDKLLRQRKPDQYEIDQARKELEVQKLFESCQIFGCVSWRQKVYDPNTTVMFSDDHEVMWFADRLIAYKDLASYQFVSNRETHAHTTTKTKGGITRAVVGGALAGGAGAVVGAMTAKSQSNTTYYTIQNGFFLQIFLKNGQGYQYPIPADGVLMDKIPKGWLSLGTKLQSIIETNQ